MLKNASDVGIWYSLFDIYAIMNEYYLVVNGKPAGPFGIDELKSMRLKPDDFLKTAAMADFKEAHEIAELRSLFNFQQRITAPQYFAGLDQRLTAALLDLLMVSGIYILPAFAAIMLIDDHDIRIAIAISLLLLIPLTNFVYHVVSEGSARQATYGKQILKISVCNIDGGPIGMGQAFGRNMAKIFSVLSLGIGLLVCFFNRKQQTLHDIMAGTLVVKERLF